MAAVLALAACGEVSVSPADGAPTDDIDAAQSDIDGSPDRPDAQPPGMCVDGVTELLRNAGFEVATQEGATGWSEVAVPAEHLTFPEDQLGGFTVHEGNRAAWMGRATASDQRLSQVVTVPAGNESLTLSFYKCLVTDEDPGEIFDRMTVSLLDREGDPLEPPLIELTNQQAGASCSWNLETLEAKDSHANEEVELEFHVVTDNGTATSFFVDDVSLEARGPCPDAG
jgi:hypothetical protein